MDFCEIIWESEFRNIVKTLLLQAELWKVSLVAYKVYEVNLQL
jgi:hypothetical protein